MSDKMKPPHLAERFLSLFLNPADKEMVVGDFAELYLMMVETKGSKRAWIWYWGETFKALPALIFLSKNKINRSIIMKNFFGQSKRVATVGMILMVPAFLLILGGLLHSFGGLSHLNDALNFKGVLFHPIIVLGGLILAFGLNLIPVVRLSFQAGEFVGRVRVRDNGWSLGLIGLVGLFGMIIFLYLLAENFQLFQGILSSIGMMGLIL